MDFKAKFSEECGSNFRVVFDTPAQMIPGPPGPKGDKGDKGEKGDRGEKGSSGYTPIKGVDYFDGEDGYTPVKGTDYWTEDDVSEILSYVDDKVLEGLGDVDAALDGIIALQESLIGGDGA